MSKFFKHCNTCGRYQGKTDEGHPDDCPRCVQAKAKLDYFQTLPEANPIVVAYRAVEACERHWDRYSKAIDSATKLLPQSHAKRDSNKADMCLWEAKDCGYEPNRDMVSRPEQTEWLAKAKLDLINTAWVDAYRGQEEAE